MSQRGTVRVTDAWDACVVVVSEVRPVENHVVMYASVSPTGGSVFVLWRVNVVSLELGVSEIVAPDTVNHCEREPEEHENEGCLDDAGSDVTGMSQGDLETLHNRMCCETCWMC